MDDRKWRILVVDDEPNNLQLMRQILGDYYKMAFAPNGFKALEIALKLKVDLILLDIMMPGMDGYQVCEKLKSDPETSNIPIIFVTAKDEAKDETRGLELGAIDYITKPINPAIVRSRVRNHLNLKRAYEKIENQNKELIESARLREDVERITRHDLKAPLNAIITLPRIMMMEADLPAKHISHLKLIEESGLNMLRMINLSLDLFKMERGIYPFQAASVDILQLVGKILNELWEIIKTRYISIEILINDRPAGDQDNFMALGEELLCYSMLANLIKNALEASPPGEKVIISLNHVKNIAVISIHNTGAVPENIRDRFFDKYVTHKNGGTGLGTYSARLMAETQAGSINFETSEEKGTTVTVLLHAPQF